MSRAVVATLAVLLLVGSLAASPAVATSSADRLQTPDQFDTTTFRVTLYENGSATWTIEHYQPLETQNETEQFRAYASNFEDNETELYRNLVDDAEALTRVGTNETGRQMDARNFQRSAGVEPAQDRGAVQMSFLWENFAQTYDERVVVSDVFEDGFYLRSQQRMVFEHDTSMVFTAAEPEPDSLSTPQSLADSQSITYVGERSFNDNRPYVELGPPSSAQGTPTENETTVAASAGESMWQFALVLAVVALGVVAAAAWRSGAAGAVLGGNDADGGSGTESVSEPTADTAVEEPELLNDDDRVIKLLEENGGRMKQVDIVQTTDWSKSKVSMLLSDMEEEGDISKLRVGRENIISLAGEEPDAAGSPFDEE
ncbi:helix-turn-helix domain-containing protein [Halomicroarcula sp. F28]|uniref:helix-turn-helix transcriptional regulator n=1 Tax=Haloarcula salinisoli TaxID=2487746 RepID=UPI001C73DC9D|nr:helix-turn-helix domain-containing protein [Halomicroarcula salinisoli]MBX0285344.1 helix-turn-helix domain-containing protein [Halomicroarcula salinisoli]